MGASDIAKAVAKQLQIEIVEQLIDMEGESLYSPGDFVIPLKMLLSDGSKATLQVHIQQKV